MKNFFSNIWFRCISVLLVIILISGASIAILSDVLYVSPEERTQRGIMKVYGSLVEYQTVYDVDSADYTIDTVPQSWVPLINQENGEITKIYQIGDNEFLFQSIGFGGFKNGTVTVWVVVDVSADKPDVLKVVLESNKAQSLIGNLKSDFYNNFTLDDVTDLWLAGKPFVTKGDGILNPVAGATYSANAGNNAVNCVLNFIREVFSLDEN